MLYKGTKSSIYLGIESFGKDSIPFFSRRRADMSKISKLLIITLLLILAACNKPQTQPKTVPSDTEIIEPATDTPQDVTLASETVTYTPDAQTSDPSETPPPDGPPAEPTADLDQVITGARIPLYPAGTEITILELTMVDNLTGWGIGVANPDTPHIFRTVDGGITWQDVTPPQPIVVNNGGLSMAEYGAWDAENAWVAYGGAEYIWATSDGGVTWNPAPVAFMTTYDGMFSILDENHVWFYQFLEGGMQNVFTAVNRSSDGGDTWELLLDPYDDASIQAFDKTGSAFISPEYGWLTRDFRGVDPHIRLNLTSDSGITWNSVEIPPPPPLPDLFQHNLAGLYDPYLITSGHGYFRLFCRYFENDLMIDRDFLYKTSNNGVDWEILEAPRGDFYYINDLVIFSIGREIYKSTDGGVSWQFVKSVNWDGKFSFADQNNALAVAYDPDDDEYALVKTTDGCKTFTIIKPQLLDPGTTR
jgi:photosystem II stability/assembly factor-like uncharacterized protein